MEPDQGIRFIRILKPAENYEICPKCDGTGCCEGEMSIADFVEECCNLCDGKGQIDWVTYMRYKGSERKYD